MPTCQSCEKQWSWFDTIKQLLRLRTRMKCHQCREFQYQSQASRNKMSLVALLPMILTPVLLMFGLSKFYILLFDIVLIIGVFLTMPFMLKLSNKDEPLW